MSISLRDLDPASTAGAPGDDAATKAATADLGDRLNDLQERLYAEGTRSLLVVFQAMDTGGKDGAIKQIFRRVNPAGVRVAGFKQPSKLEAAHDFLWREHAEVPAQGELVIFNRSHYESVLIGRVHGDVTVKECKRRYRHIKHFEELLASNGTTVVKFFFHISKAEQRKRLLARLDDPTKRWKFNVGDIAERARWDDYMTAYEDAINATSTDDAPWIVVPADKKWFRDYTVMRELVATLERMDPAYPARSDLDDVDRDAI